MINKRLLSLAEDSLTHVKIIVASQVLGMLAHVLLIFMVASQIQGFYQGEAVSLVTVIQVYLLVILVRSTLKGIIAKRGAMAGAGVKIRLRKAIYQKILALGGRESNLSTAELVQVSSEGVEQLELYFANYLPQFFYCMTAPLLLFLILAQIHFYAAFVLFLCVPFIPISIMVVQKIAKKLLSKYWTLYANLGDSFLENIQGLTTLKVYGADEAYHQEMNENAQHFRKITMKVLSMQLNSIIIMDIIAYGGASLGAILSIQALAQGQVDLMGAIVIILLASEYFLPMRLLGSYFHIAMNGMAASKKIFAFLDEPLPPEGGTRILSKEGGIALESVNFSYQEGKEILSQISFTVEKGMTALVGVSGCGKSTITSLLMGKYPQYQGSIRLFGIELRDICFPSLYKEVTRVSDTPYLFGGTVAENLRMGKATATSEEMIVVLEQANIWTLFQEREGLDTILTEGGSNLSGGEKQRLNLARALLKETSVYLFDEVTSNIDVESEDAIMKVIQALAKEKIVILISHRLANVVKADQILFLQEGRITETGNHASLLAQNQHYATLYQTQEGLENLGRKGERV